MNLVIATHNPKKATEMSTILRRGLPNVAVRTLADYPGAPEPEETGTTYAENAAIKAKSAAEFTHEWTIADDAGLEIDFLAGAPGLHSKRFGGESMRFPDKIARVLELMRDAPEDRRAARFRCCVAVCVPAGCAKKQTTPRVDAPFMLLEGEPPVYVFESVCEGRIGFEPRGSGGFGYDPIFYYPELGRTFAELSPDEKHAVSHRGKVLRFVIEWLRGLDLTL